MTTRSIYVPTARFVKSHRGTAPLVALAAAALLLLLGLAGCSGLIASKTSTPATATLTANPATLNFCDVALGNYSTQNSTLTNTGNSKVTVSGVAASSSEFMVSGVPGGTTLSSGQSAVLTVTFKPSSSGNATGTITISSNANNPPIITLLGASPSPHSVGLTWSPSTSPVVGYYVYRGTVTNGPYAKLNLVAAICGDPVYGFECSSRTDLYLRRYRRGCKYHGKFVFQSSDCNRSVTIGKPQDHRPRLGPEKESAAAVIEKCAGSALTCIAAKSK